MHIYKWLLKPRQKIKDMDNSQGVARGSELVKGRVQKGSKEEWYFSVLWLWW